MSVQFWLDSEARRLLAEELQADATEATAPSYDSRFKGLILLLAAFGLCLIGLFLDNGRPWK